MGSKAATTKEAPLLRGAGEKVVEAFSADLRSLAAFRMVLAVLVLADLADRATDLYAHYTDGGILPRSVLVEGELSPWSFSLNLISGELYFQVLIFGIGALGALALLVGYHTRLVSVIVWVVMLSIQYRNPLLLSAADPLLRLLVFWGMFLPLGAYCSFDRLLKSTPPRRIASRRLSMRFVSLATVGLFLQIAFMYWFTALQKTGVEWRVEGSAIYYTLSLDQLATPFGTYLLNFPTLLTVLTFATLALEFVGPFLLFYPFLTGPVRTGIVLIFMSFHFGVWLTLNLGIFPWVSALCMVCFLPSWFWEKTTRLRSAFLSKNPQIMERLQRTLARLLPVHTYQRLFQLRSSSALGAVVGGGPGTTQQSQARSGGAKEEEEAGQGKKTDDASSSTSEPAMLAKLRSSLATNLLAAFFLVYIFLWNLTTVSSFTMPQGAVSLAHMLGLQQGWSMFAPYPTTNDVWYVIPGTLSNGQQVDLMGFIRDEPSLPVGVSWEKPAHTTDTFKNEHWRKYLESIQEGEREDLSGYLGDYLCREWNARHTGAQRLESVQVTYVTERTLPNYQRATPQKAVISGQRCS